MPIAFAFTQALVTFDFAGLEALGGGSPFFVASVVLPGTNMRLAYPATSPLVAFLLLAFGWIAATLFKIRLCLEIGVQACR